MHEDPPHTASLGYALGRLARALETVATHPDAQTRRRAESKVEQWRAVLEGAAAGTLTVGSRTPLANTPEWVTLEVAHGGFATGRYLAEGPLLPHEHASLEALPAEIQGSSERERLNRWYLGDAGQAELLAAHSESTRPLWGKKGVL